jgi:orotidine-5'-phosphate decarboxylase
VSRLIVALDFPTAQEAASVAAPLVEEVAGFKVGLELLMAEGPAAIERIAELGAPVFADAKLHDIPNTVERASARLAASGARWVTVHASGGQAMMEAANRGMGDRGILAVTVLTSFEDRDLETTGVTSGLETQVVALASLAEGSDVEGLVCAPGDVVAIRAKGIALQIFTPGIRMEGGAVHDQKRVGTPAEAVDAGADYLVIGRPVTRSADPLAAIREIAASLTRIA